MFRQWYHFAALGALVLVALYFAIWAIILQKMDEVENDE